VHPPVDTAFFQPGTSTSENHFLIVSALVPYKRIELAIQACAQVGAELRIIGDGPDRTRLGQSAGSSVTFLGPRSGETLRDEFRRARAVLLPGEEDFGIVPVEAQACGTPVVALARGGALETVADGVTGVLFDEPTAAAMAHALQRVNALDVDGARLHLHAERFSRERHVNAIRSLVDETMAAPAGTRW
jgi:glycosyltransferase involved in cell wall biosynthesis